MTTVSFTPIGANQTWVVPAGVTSIDVSLQGGNGGPPWAADSVSPIIAGRGARVTGTIAVVPGETLTLQVAYAGEFGAITNANGDRIGGTPGGSFVTGFGGWPDGGSGGLTGTGHAYGGGGGGSTRIWRGGVGGTLLFLAAGGGGIGFTDGTLESGSPSTFGNAGQPSPGQDGRNVDRNNVALLQPGHGGTLIAGGTGTAGAASGASLLGGDGATYTVSPFTYSGGGGGGGLFGGSGGGRELASARLQGSQGGGGSSYADPGATALVWDQNPHASSGGIAQSQYVLDAGGLIEITFEAETTPVGWSLGLVKMLG